MKVYPTEIISDAKGKVLRILLSNGERYRLSGHCLRCGKCCNNCPELDYEIFNGEKVARCSINSKKPWNCKMYPTNPYDEKEILEGCGYYWEKI